MDDRALRKKEYEDLLNYCKADNRATPTHWGKVTLILEIEKLLLVFMERLENQI